MIRQKANFLSGWGILPFIFRLNRTLSLIVLTGRAGRCLLHSLYYLVYEAFPCNTFACSISFRHAINWITRMSVTVFCATGLFVDADFNKFVESLSFLFNLIRIKTFCLNAIECKDVCAKLFWLDFVWCTKTAIFTVVDRKFTSSTKGGNNRLANLFIDTQEIDFVKVVATCHLLLPDWLRFVRSNVHLITLFVFKNLEVLNENVYSHGERVCSTRIFLWKFEVQTEKY